ncbi:2'-5' RNA ligase family protein [Nocardioides currus]|uniref:2'-5' RNA ligase family protein n=1 Tax=Nocardioides currus TaxID=2133958 RepID=A0A2R7YUZ5_9ACTN|nr:2'-5' RNA ligase family protein [Nocardioides currus]PUA80230.1 hypothetical protein C7S10_13865 [Nocardioides currus]
MSRRPGHSVIVVPVPELDAVVRDRTARYDDSYVSTDPAFVHAHITLLGPWLDEPTARDLETVERVLASEPAFDVRLATLGEFPDGILHLRPEPAAPLARMTSRLAEAFPQTPPYEGRYPEVVPHLTLDHRATGASVEGLGAELDLPVTTRVDRVDLQWWANDDCRVLRTWRWGR